MSDKIKNYERVWENAEVAGYAAAKATIPTPMIVGTPTTPLGDDIDPSKTIYYVPQGVCGFASIHFKGNTSFGRWAKKAEKAKKAYGVGLYAPVSVGGQSYETKVAYARAFVGVLQEEDIEAWVESRLD
jgi:hypothetical protein